MGEAHGRFRAVDVLAAGAAGAEHVDLEVLLGDVHIDGVVQFGADVDGGEAGVAALGGVEGGDAHQAVHARLRPQVPIAEGRADDEGGALDARFLAVLVVDHLRGPALGLTEPQVHAQQHGGPVLALGAAGAGGDGHDGVVAVQVPAEHHAQFGLVHPGPQLAFHVLGLAEHLRVLAAEFEGGLQVLEAAGELPGQGHVIGHGAALLQDGPRRIGVVPETRGRNALFDLLQLQGQALGVQVPDHLPDSRLQFVLGPAQGFEIHANPWPDRVGGTSV
jgi:hypothetical protein